MTRSPRVCRTHPYLSLVLVGLAAISACALIASGARSAGTAQGLIAFTREGADAVYVMRPDGSGVRVLLPQGASDVAWSPDGSKLAASKGRSIWVVNADGSNPERIARVGASSLSWSADGRRIAFTRWYRADDRDVWVMNADGSDMHRVKRTPRLWDSNVDWRPTGGWLAFDSGSWVPEIYVMRADGTRLRKLTTAESWGKDSSAPDWSPDGRRIALTKDNKVWVMNASGKEMTQLTRSGSVEHSPTWSPDGRKIAFVRESSEIYRKSSEIYVMNADGTGVTRLTRNKVVEASLAWQPFTAP